MLDVDIALCVSNTSVCQPAQTAKLAQILARVLVLQYKYLYVHTDLRIL